MRQCAAICLGMARTDDAAVIVTTRKQLGIGHAASATKGDDDMADFSVMISSTQVDLQQERNHVEQAIQILHLKPLRSETVGSRSGPSRDVCRQMARECGLYILILGERYGWVDVLTGKSVTELEFDEAQRADPTKILVYKTAATNAEPDQQAFVSRVEDFDQGYFRRPPFETPEQLEAWVREDIASWLTERATTPSTTNAGNEVMAAKQRVAVAREQWRSEFGQGPWVGVCLAPVHAAFGVTPYQLGDRAFIRKLSLMALQSEPPLFDMAFGTGHAVEEDRLRIWQGDGRQEVAEVEVHLAGLVSVRVSLEPQSHDRYDVARSFYAEPEVAKAKLTSILNCLSAFLPELGSKGTIGQMAVSGTLGGMRMRNFASIPTDSRSGVSFPMIDGISDPLHVPSQVEVRRWNEITGNARTIASQWTELMERAYARRR